MTRFVSTNVVVLLLLLVGSALLSPQFLLWPLPFVAMAAGGGSTRLERWAFAVAALTLLDWIFFDPHRPALFRTELAILGRNVALVGLLVVAVVELRQTANRRHSIASPTTV